MADKRDWKEGSYIRSELDFNEEEEKEEFYFAWFHTQSNMKPTPREEEERKAAIREQIAAGVIQPNGLPVGYNTPPQPTQQKRNETPYERQMRRKQERKLERKLNKKGQTLIRK